MEYNTKLNLFSDA